MEENTITFHAKHNGEENKEIIKITQGKFYWLGEEIEDKYEVYERFNEWLKLAENK